MCGVLGLINFDMSIHSNEMSDRITVGLAKLAHRGPDNQSMAKFNTSQAECYLGHARLSIIDLNDHANQPMISADGRFALTFNGEIYNFIELRKQLVDLGHQFQTSSDTEVLLNCWSEWGEACIPKLTGMFAFAVLDQQAKQLFCVRDAFGIKPFYYQINKNQFCFASEVAALNALMPERSRINETQSLSYLINGVYDRRASSCFYEGMATLPPGYLLSFDLAKNELSELKHWWSPSLIENRTIKFSDAAEQLRSLLLDSVKLHLRSDVSWGVALSGGIDSSTLACIVRYLEPDLPIKTFSYIANDKLLDESVWIDLLNQYVGAEAHKVNISSDTLLTDIKHLIQSQGEPFVSTSIYAQYKVNQAAKAHGIKVFLEGQGADEMFCGYLGFPGERLSSIVNADGYMDALCYLLAWSKNPKHRVPYALQAYLANNLPNWLKVAGLKQFGNQHPSWINADFCHANQTGVEHPILSFKNTGSNREMIQRLYDQLTGNGLNALLRHGDRNSMAFSIENRVPFLTTQMAEFILHLPEDFLISKNGVTKCLLREAMRNIVPNEVLDRQDKIGFETPEKQMIMRLKPLLFEVIEIAKQIPIFEPSQVTRFLTQFLSNNSQYNPVIWRIVNYCLWYEQSFL